MSFTLYVSTAAKYKAQMGPSISKVSIKNQGEDLSTDVFKPKLYSLSSREASVLYPEVYFCNMIFLVKIGFTLLQ